MKSLIPSTGSKTFLLVVLLGSLIGSLATAQAGTRHAFFVGAMNIAPANHRPQSGEGYLLVYSATDPIDDGDLVFNVHSSYSIYTRDGKLFKNVENHMSRSDEIPELVRLPAGPYTVEARSGNNGFVRIQVQIKPARQTIIDLDR